MAGVLSPGKGGLFVDKGSVANIDTITESGANRTETLYEGIYTFVSNRIILQFRVSPTGVVQVRTNSDWQYLNWRPWKNLTVETPSTET